jgi:hypothetical protein
VSLSTYTELKSAVADWLNRVGQTELEARAGDFILLFESLFDKQDIRHPKSSVRATATVTGEYTALPTDFLEMQRLRTTGGSAGWTTHRYVTPEELEDDKALNQSSDRPHLFTVDGNEIQIRPYSASGTYTLEMLYWAKLTKLSGSVASNWLLVEAPEAYLFGALCEATPFIRDDERVALWTAKRDQAVASLRAAAERAALTSGTLKPRRRKLG